MAVHEGGQLHHTPVPSVIGGGLAQHDLGHLGKDLPHALATCSSIFFDVQLVEPLIKHEHWAG